MDDLRDLFGISDDAKCPNLSALRDLTGSEMGKAKEVTDRRIPRTRGMLQQALMSLILKKEYQAITIQDICDTANLGRSTFYAHYTSKDDLKRSSFEHLRRELADRQRRALATPGDIRDRRLGFSLAMFEHARDHRVLHRALVRGRGGAIALCSIRQILSDLVRDELAATRGDNSSDAMPRELVVQHVVGAFMAVLSWWLDGGARLPPEQIDAMFRRLVTEGIVSSGC
jgi:AcrR family transcriptional regulator